MKRFIQISLLPLILVGTVITLTVLKRVLWDEATASNKKSGSPKDPPAVTVETVAHSSLSETITLNGTLYSLESIDLKSEISGKITSVHFEDGQKVKSGDILVKMSDRELRAEAASIKAKLELAKRQAERKTGLFSRGLISETEHDVALNEQDVLSAQVELLRVRIAKTVLRSPFDGRIGLREVSPGAVINPDVTISSIQKLDPLHLDFSVPERYQSMVKPGMPVSLNVAGYEQEFVGRISATSHQIDEITRSLRLRAIVPNPEEILLPGNFATVSLTLKEYHNTVLIPASALEQSINDAWVYLVDANNLAKQRPVTVGVRQADSIQILSGLNVGDRVVSRGIGLADGIPVRVISSSPSNNIQKEQR